MNACTSPLKQFAPVHEFKADTGQEWCQRFAVLEENTGFRLVVVTKRGNRGVGQANFPTVFSAEAWAKQQLRCYGPFDVY